MTEIYSRLVDHTMTSTNQINDFSVGSAMRAIYEAVSIELEQFYILTKENIEEAIELGVYESFDFERQGATRAHGKVQISFHNTTQQRIIISRGSRFMSSDSRYTQVYETMTEYIVPSGTTLAEVDVYATVPGSTGNIPAETIDIMSTPVNNVKSVTNPRAFQTGQNEEPMEELRSRFRSFIESLSKATVPALEYGTREINEVSGVWVNERTGFVIVYAHDRNGNLSDQLKNKIKENLYYYRPGGIPVEVRPVTRRDIDVNVIVTLSSRASSTEMFRTQIQLEIERYLNNMQTSQSLVLADLSRVIMNMDRQFIRDVEFVTPEDNVTLRNSELIRARNIRVVLQNN